MSIRLKFRFRSKPKQFLYRTESCLNCFHPLDISDRFCPSCGQKNSSKPLTLKSLITEYFSGLFAYDSRFSKTIGALVCSPGKISQEYVEGRRVKYVNPFRFFISIAILFFLMVSLINKDQLKTIDPDKKEELKAEKLDEFENEIEFLKPALTSGMSDLISENLFISYSEAQNKLKFENSFYNEVKFKFVKGAMHISSDPQGFLDYLLPKFPFFLFFYIPLFTVFSSLIYINKKIPYVHHLIFNYNQQSVFLILLFLYVIFDFIYLWIWLLLYAFYLYKSMKRYYTDGRFITILKQFIIMNAYWISAILVLSSLAVLSIAFY